MNEFIEREKISFKVLPLIIICDLAEKEMHMHYRNNCVCFFPPEDKVLIHGILVRLVRIPTLTVCLWLARHLRDGG